MLRAAFRNAALAAGALGFGAAGATPAGATIDVQVSLCGAPATIERALDLRQRGAAFDVWLFDDPALALFNQGLRIRLRGANGGAELTLKVADQDCANLPANALPAGEGKCEYDLHGSTAAGALSLTRKVDTHMADELMTGRLPLANALSTAQTTFLQGRAGAWPLPPQTRALGPTRVRSYTTGDKTYVVDVSELPGGERFIEISRKVPLADARRVRAQLDADMAKAGVAACADQSAQAVNKLRALLRRP